MAETTTTNKPEASAQTAQTGNASKSSPKDSKVLPAGGTTRKLAKDEKFIPETVKVRKGVYSDTFAYRLEKGGQEKFSKNVIFDWTNVPEDDKLEILMSWARDKVRNTLRQLSNGERMNPKTLAYVDVKHDLIDIQRGGRKQPLSAEEGLKQNIEKLKAQGMTPEQIMEMIS